MDETNRDGDVIFFTVTHTEIATECHNRARINDEAAKYCASLVDTLQRFPDMSMQEKFSFMEKLVGKPSLELMANKFPDPEAVIKVINKRRREYEHNATRQRWHAAHLPVRTYNFTTQQVKDYGLVPGYEDDLTVEETVIMDLRRSLDFGLSDGPGMLKEMAEGPAPKRRRGF